MKKGNLIFALAAILAMSLIACEGHRGASGSDTTVTKRSADADKLPKVLVRPFEAKGIDDNDASGLTSTFCTNLSKSKKFELLCWDDVSAMISLKELLDMTGSCGDDCMTKVDEQIKPDKAIHASISKVGEAFVVQVKVIDGKTGQIEVRVSSEVGSSKQEDLLPVMGDLAEKVIAEL